MIGSNGVIAVILLVDMSALLLYNVSGMCVTGKPHVPQPVALGFDAMSKKNSDTLHFFII